MKPTVASEDRRQQARGFGHEAHEVGQARDVLGGQRLSHGEVGAQHFPHIYGEINLDAVTQVLDFEPNVSGEFELPHKLSVSS